MKLDAFLDQGAGSDQNFYIARCRLIDDCVFFYLAISRQAAGFATKQADLDIERRE